MSGIYPSGAPSSLKACNADVATCKALESASPTSSLACTMSRLKRINGSTPLSIKRKA